MPLRSHISSQLKHLPNAKRWVVAFSGGLDSTVLLHAAVNANQQLETPLPVIALHVNHQISSSADDWQQHCQQIAQLHRIEFVTYSVNVATKNGIGLEASAREQRYQVFESFLEDGDVLLMAHHLNDQAETVLLRLLRGAGVRGLGAMAAQRALGSGVLFRPLLTVSRLQLEDYAKAFELEWIEDDSNLDTTLDRNFLRQKIFPVLTQRWPKAITSMSRSADNLQASEALLNDLAEIDLQTADFRKERFGSSLSWLVLQNLSMARRNNLLRFWCDTEQMSTPEIVHLQEVAEQFFKGNAATTAAVNWGNSVLRFYNQRLYLTSSLPIIEPLNEAEIKVGQLLCFDNCSVVELYEAEADAHNNDAKKKCIDFKKTNGRPLTIRWRQGGERALPVGRAHSQSLKKLLQEYQLETWLRDRVPLLYCGDELVAVGDLWVNKPFAAEDCRKGLYLQWSINS